MAFVQVGSDAIFRDAGVPRSVPAQMSQGLGVRVYRTLAREAPAPYVFEMLARAALARGDLRAAQRDALALPVSAKRSDLLGDIALARGDRRAALHLFINADDIFAIARQVDTLAARDPAAAFRLEMQLKDHLERTATHPDALADSYWRLGTLSAAQGKSAQAMREFAHAAALSPLSGKYLLAAGFQAYDLRQAARARAYFLHALAADPASADALAGAGLAALQAGNRAGARSFAARARAIDPQDVPLRTLDRLLQ